MIGLLFLVSSAASVDARFVLEVSNVAVAELHVGTRGDSYFYEVTPFFSERAPARVERKLSQGTPEVFALLTVPKTGCRDVIEERSGAVEKLCVARSDATSASGTIDGKAFTARYEKNRLSSITVGDAKWRAVTVTPKPGANPFEDGVAVPVGVLHFVPEVPGAQWLPASPRGVGGGDVSRERCLVLARRFVETHSGSEVVTGLVIADGRAVPHAWVKTAAGDVDPSVLPDDGVLSRRKYVRFPAEMSGSLYLALFAGSLRLEAR
ncbi:MAG: hypothetical protein ACO1OB_10900 [Archangium sp.]